MQLLFVFAVGVLKTNENVCNSVNDKKDIEQNQNLKLIFCEFCVIADEDRGQDDVDNEHKSYEIVPIHVASAIWGNDKLGCQRFFSLWNIFFFLVCLLFLFSLVNYVSDTPVTHHSDDLQLLSDSNPVATSFVNFQFFLTATSHHFLKRPELFDLSL